MATTTGFCFPSGNLEIDVGQMKRDLVQLVHVMHKVNKNCSFNDEELEAIWNTIGTIKEILRDCMDPKNDE